MLARELAAREGAPLVVVLADPGPAAELLRAELIQAGVEVRAAGEVLRLDRGRRRAVRGGRRLTAAVSAHPFRGRCLERHRQRGDQMAEGQGKELKGRLKEAAGALSGDHEAKREGRREQREGKLEQAKEKASDAVDAAKDAFRR